MIEIDNLIKEAMMSKDKVALRTYRAVKSKFIEFETSKEHKTLDENAKISIVNKMIKEREETAKIYRDNNRIELMESELDEVKVLKSLIPEQLPKEEVESRINEMYPDGIDKKSMGLAIKTIKAALGGLSDGKTISDIVKTKLI